MSDSILSAPPSLPAGYLATPLFPESATAPLRICLVTRKDADPAAGHFVTLRTLLDAIVYLGCITDSGGRLHGYVEIWVQSLNGLTDSPAAAREAISNRVLDDRWVKLFKAFDALDDQAAGSLFRTGYETSARRACSFMIQRSGRSFIRWTHFPTRPGNSARMMQSLRPRGCRLIRHRCTDIFVRMKSRRWCRSPPAPPQTATPLRSRKSPGPRVVLCR